MIERITKNEERLDKSLKVINDLEHALKEFNKNKNDLRLLTNYYGSDNWFKDKDAYESNKIEHIKAGVLSEDTVWNMLEDFDDILKDMNKIIKYYERDKK